ncbi:hypothetical protein Goari_021947 [Gossypium aridum]|uniref:DUF7745 domain-containing protein n=1 Tax=Gossypium aridum TaxID=34290 RepID=A0A7J8YNJ8_GOSAI|nr:hypothetical protein [Gossypium aridum]
MEKEFLDKVEDNAAVRIWAETTQQEKGDSLTKGYVSKLWDFTHLAQFWNPAFTCFTFGKVDLVPTVEEYLCISNFPKALRHLDESVSDLFDRLSKGVTPVLAILAETFRSLNACWRAGEGRFIGCAQLLLAWFHSHFWKVEKVSYRVFSDSYSPLEELVATPRQDDVLEEK